MSQHLEAGWHSDTGLARRGQQHQPGRTPTSTTSVASRARSRSSAEPGFSFDDDRGPVTRKPSFVDEGHSPVTRKPSFAANEMTETTPISRKPSFMNEGNTPTRTQHNDYDAEIDTIVDEQMDPPMLVFKGMSARTWDNRPILEDVSGYLCEGQIMGVMGLYGSGKTTFLHGLIATSDDNIGKGSRSYQGDIFAQPKLRVGYVGQDTTLLEHLRVGEMIRFALALSAPGLDQARLEKRMQRWVTKLDLAQVLDQPLNVLSTGQRRRVGLVLVLVRSCNLMIMDEPLTGLDSFTGMEIMRELRKIADTEKISVVVSLSQLKDQLFHYLDLSLVLHEGKTAYFGPAQDTMAGLAKLAGVTYTDFAPGSRALPEPNSGSTPGHSPLPQAGVPPAHKLHDFLFAHRNHVEEARKTGSQLPSITEQFANSRINQMLMETITHVLTDPDSQLEPYKLADAPSLSKGLYWRRVRVGTRRFLTDMWRDRTAWLSLVFLPVLMVAVVSAVFFNMGSEITLNFPMVQGAFLFSLASLIVLQAQLTIPRCCRLYQLFRQEHIDGTQSLWQFVAEAVLCTFGFSVVYGALTAIATLFWLNSAEIYAMQLINAVVLAISSQIIVWASVFATNGSVLATLMVNAAVQLVYLGCDGFMIPFAHIRTPYVLFYYLNPRAWFMQATMVDLMCGAEACEASPFSDDVLFSAEATSLRAQLAYSQGSEVVSYKEVNEYLQSLLIDYFDLDAYTAVEGTGYAVAVLVAAGAVALLLLHGALWLFHYAHKGVEERFLNFLTKYNIDVKMVARGIVAFVVLVMLIASGSVAGKLQKSASSSSDKVIGYDPQMTEICKECIGVPKLTDLLSSTEDIYDTSLFIQRLDITTRALLGRVPAINDLCEEQNFFKPTHKRLQVQSLQQLFDDYFPRNYVNYIQDRDDFVNLVNAEGRLARWWMDVASADVLHQVTSLSDPYLTGFQIGASAELENYLVNTYGMTLSDAMADKRLYVFTRVPGLDSLDPNFIDDDHLQLNPHALFFRNSSDSYVHTVAVQLKNSGESQIMVPSAGFGWAAAKTFVRHGMFLRGVMEHFVRCHHLLAAVGVAAENTMDADHPVRQVLFISSEPQLYAQVIGTIVNALVPLQNLTAAQQLELTRAYEKDFQYYRDIPYDYHSTYRGVWDLNDGLYLPLRPLLHEYWDEVQVYAQKVVDYTYPNDAAVQHDKQLKRWKELIQDPKGGNVKGLFEDGVTCELCTKNDVTQLLAELIFSAFRHTTSLIIEMSCEAMYYPYMASNIRVSRLPADGDDFDEQEFLDMFSDSEGVLDHMTFFSIGLTLVQRRLDQWPSRITDPYLKDLAHEFVDNVVLIARNYGDVLGVNIAPRMEGFPQW